MLHFPCNACGQCCRRVHLSEQTIWLDRGDGVCCHFDENTHLCQIYEQRPLVCRIADYYRTYLSEHLTWEEFVKINQDICKQWQMDSNRKS